MIIKKKGCKLILGYFLAAVVAICFFYLLFLSYYQNRFFPGVKISGIDVSGQTPTAVTNNFSRQFQSRKATNLKLTHQELSLTLNLNESNPQLDLKKEVNKAYSLGRSKDLIKDLYDQFQALRFGANFTPKVTYLREDYLNSELTNIAKAANKEPVNARVIPNENLTLTPSEDGYELDTQTLRQQLDGYLNLSATVPTALPIKVIHPEFNTAAAQKAKQALESVVANPITLKFNQSTWTINQPILFGLLDFGHIRQTIPTSNIGQNIVDNELLLNQDRLSSFLKDVSASINQESRDARFSFDRSVGKVKEFQMSQEGRKLDTEKTASLITQALNTSSSREIELPVEIVKPQIDTADVNSLGITELIGQGVSNFSGSIENRIYNIKLAASRINGVLVAPGENFSFNKVVGDISAASGYKQAYVIKSGRTVLDDGGGVCQVSTTVFRAALNSGLPITERTAHAYRVGYYEQGFPPGLDATIFSPSVDFKFKNDTPAHILVQAYVVGTTLTVDFYGTKDGRIVNLTKPQILSQTPPLPEIRQDDPTLPKGTIKQVDWPAWGAKVVFSRTVTKGGEEIIKETFTSNYRPWQAVYLVGTKG